MPGRSPEIRKLEVQLSDRIVAPSRSNCGYLLKTEPPVLPKSGTSSGVETAEMWPPAGLAPPQKLRVVVLSGDHLPKREGERCEPEEWDQNLEVLRC